jgi:hypothetical protein
VPKAREGWAPGGDTMSDASTAGCPAHMRPRPPAP